MKNKNTVDFRFENDIYIPRILPTKKFNELLILKLNRRQNELDYIVANAETGIKNTIYTETENEYIEESNFDYIQFIDVDNSFIYLSEKSDYNHIHLFKTSINKSFQLTQGNWDITDVYGYNELTSSVYFQAALPSPLHREIKSININNNETKDLTIINKGINNAIFSQNKKYFLNFRSNINTPTNISLFDSNGGFIRELETNKDLALKLKNLQIPEKKFISLLSADEKTKLNASIIKPFNFDKTKKYPLLIIQYSGPNSQKVLDKWSFNWEYFLAQDGYLVLTVDTRGTGARGENFKKKTYLQLGTLETEDLIASARQMAEKEFVDENRIGIWGWSYGGFTAISSLFKSQVFKAAVAIAPVTDWRFYDNIYTERFMQKPIENEEGYTKTSLLNMVDEFNHGKLLIVHGTADDNVHLQNTLELSSKLVEANKQFSMHIYKNKNHSLSGLNSHLHLFTMVFEFLEKYLK